MPAGSLARKFMQCKRNDALCWHFIKKKEFEESISNTSNLWSVSVGCTSSMFWVVAEPTLLGQDHILHSDEASLGTGCPVTNVTAKGYEFNYPATECGIQKEVEASHPSLLLNMSHPLLHESANVAIF
ncbi:oocyte-secreted protein 3 isoform X7 [Macaca fascicularis]|uniref:oocyte-secreted protein 3 isoform X7 n=1 Tax=Macaca fascicularis TaxID=9541 RepID=UPI003D15EA96